MPMARKLLIDTEVSVCTVLPSKGLYNFLMFFMLFWAVSCIKVRVYSPGADDDQVTVVVDSLRARLEGAKLAPR